MSTFGAGIIVIVLGVVSLILQIFIDPNRPAMPGQWTASQQKSRMTMSGVFAIMLGTVLMILINERKQNKDCVVRPFDCRTQTV